MTREEQLKEARKVFLKAKKSMDELMSLSEEELFRMNKESNGAVFDFMKSFCGFLEDTDKIIEDSRFLESCFQKDVN
jgi:hypothetical protein